jgi:hypothetical protein
MSKRELSSESMIHITETLLDPRPKGPRTILAGLPIVAVLIPTLEAAHADLLSRQVAGPPGDIAAKITAIQTKQCAAASGCSKRSPISPTLPTTPAATWSSATCSVPRA